MGPNTSRFGLLSNFVIQVLKRYRETPFLDIGFPEA